MLTIDKVQLFDHLTEQHVNEAAFLWMLRSQAVNQAQHTVASINKLERRINNHLKGLAVTPQSAWKLALEAAQLNESGEIFVLAILAFNSGESHKINIALELAAGDKEARKGFISALGWLPNDKVSTHLKSWIESKNPLHRYISVATCSLRRLDPQLYLNSLFNNETNWKNIPLLSRMLRLIGELKRHDLAPLLKKAQGHENKEIAFWAYWSALMLGDRSVLADFAPFVLQAGQHQANAIAIAFRCLEQTQAWDWVNSLAKTSEQTAQTIVALSTLGDPHCVNWLIARMEEPIHAKVAGYAFSQITGIDLMQHGLTDTRNLQPNDDDEIPVFTEYENLPVPHAKNISQYWQAIQHKFSAGYRYFLGQPIEPILLKQTLIRGNQGQRLAAALEFALLDGTRIYPNVKSTFHNPSGQ